MTAVAPSALSSDLRAKAAVDSYAPSFVDGRFIETAQKIDVRAPYDGAFLWSACTVAANDVRHAIAGAERGLSVMSQLPAHRRATILRSAADLLQHRREQLAARITLECGKPIRLARAEVDRSVQTFSFAADEARRIGGEFIPMDAQPEGEGRIAFTMRVPLGIIGAITPFNFPLNLVAHKLAPAIAAGNTVVLKPSPVTPATAVLLLELLLEAGLPPQAVQLVHGGADVGEVLVTDPRLAMITFTGGADAGNAIKARAGMKRVTLELGSNAAVIIDRDTADLDKVAARCVSGAFHYSGQSCISLQRIFVHYDIYDEFVDVFLAETRKLRLGDPGEETTDVGPVISEAAAQRIGDWIGDAVTRGGRLLAGGRRKGTLVEPTLLAEVDPGCRIAGCEVFGPVALVWPFAELGEAMARVNASRYALNTGIFTRDVKKAFTAVRRLQAGTVLVNDIPTYRVEHMPYGGVKESGVGREGLRYAIEEMTLEKLVIFNLD